jgi:hypothetical protein
MKLELMFSFMMMIMVDCNTYNYTHTSYIMTTSKFTESLLYESHSLGIFHDVLDFSKKLREEDRTLDFDGSIEKAFNKLSTK